MSLGKAVRGELELVYETIGEPSGMPLLLVMGIGGQMLSWPDGFCGTLVDQGFAVARFDNRDAGLSTHLPAERPPGRLSMLLRPAAAAAYTLADMADDAAAVMDAIGWPAAHVAGMSQGGMIAQSLAVHHPERVLTLTSIASAPSPRVGHPAPATLLKMLRIMKPGRVRNAEDMARFVVDLQRLIGSPGYPADEADLRELGRRCYERGGFDMAAMQRHTAAIASSGDRRAELARVRAPALVIHGEDDPLIRPSAGRATAHAIPGARLVTFNGMGHELPRPLWRTIAGEIAAIAHDSIDRRSSLRVPPVGDPGSSMPPRPPL